MLFLRYLLLITGFGLFTGAAAILVYDLWAVFKGRKPESDKNLVPSNERPLTELAEPSVQSPAAHGGLPSPSLREVRWQTALKLAAIGAGPILAGLSIAVIPSGTAGVRVSQISGPSPHTLYSGVHLIVPLVDHVELYNIRDNVFSTTSDGKSPDALKIQTKEGLGVTLAVTVRYRLDPSKLAYIYANLPQPVETEIVPPVVASSFRELAPKISGA